MSGVSHKHQLAHRIRLGTIATLAAGGLLLLAPSASSQTVTPQSVDPLQHFIDCAGVLITAPDIHAAYCLPSNVAPEKYALGGGSGNPVPPKGCVEADVVLDAASECSADDDGPIDQDDDE
jgi:hypothetical protein